MTLTKTPDRNSLGEGRFILARGFRHFRSVRMRKESMVVLVAVTVTGTPQVTDDQGAEGKPEAGTTV